MKSGAEEHVSNHFYLGYFAECSLRYALFASLSSVFACERDRPPTHINEILVLDDTKVI